MTDFDVEVELRVRERTAHLEAANKEFAAFVAAVAGDLRSPLRAIEGVTQVFAQQQVDGGSSACARECIDCIRQNVQHMAGMLDGLARISGGWLEPDAAVAGRGGTVPVVPGPVPAPGDGEHLDAALENLRQRRCVQPPAAGGKTS